MIHLKLMFQVGSMIQGGKQPKIPRFTFESAFSVSSLSLRSAKFFVICASAKRDFSQSGIVAAMDTSKIHVHMTVHEVLQRWPQAFSVFISCKTNCPGCFMQKFCTVEYVAETYQISAEKLTAEIESVSNSFS